MAYCRQGDLAFIVNALVAPENIGKIVKVLYSVAPDADTIVLPDGGKWRTHGAYKTLWAVETQGGQLATYFSRRSSGEQPRFHSWARFIVIPDAWLRPIRPEPETVDTSTRKEEPAM